MYLLLPILFISMLCSAQHDSTVKPVDFPDVEPEFVGGAVALQRFIGDNMIFPDLIDEEPKGGRIYMRFVVQVDGCITNVEVVRGHHPKFDEAAIQLVEKMPKWISGCVGDVPVASYVRLPISFHFCN